MSSDYSDVKTEPKTEPQKSVDTVNNKLFSGKSFLYFTAFFSGMSVMAIEQGASRLLAPYFSSSQIVWTVIIGTIMIATAIGNVWGGKAADKNPDPARLYKRLLIVAIWIALIPLVGKYIITGISLVFALFTTNNFLIWASFASCIVLFVFPLMLLGTTTPSLMKYAVTSLSDSGKTVGIIEAVGTIGSILGTFLPTFVTIPAAGTAATFLIFAGVLAVICLLYFILNKKFQVRAVVALVLIAAVAIVPNKEHFAFWQNNIVYEGESIYNYLQVSETDKATILSTNVLEGVQSIKMKDDTLTGMYYDYALAAPLMAGFIPYEDNSERSVLVLGLGTGTFTGLTYDFYGNPSIDGVEIDQKIVNLADEYFELSPNVNTVVEDGRAYLQAGSGKNKTYDLIMVDAYQDITIPFQMSSIEFFNSVKEHLTPDGVMVVNMNMHTNKEGSINDYLSSTIANVFSEVATVTATNNTNMILFASNNEQVFSEYKTMCAELDTQTLFGTQMQAVANSLTPVTNTSLILTDNKAPVELLGMQAIDTIIANTLEYYKDEFRGKSLSQILETIQ